MVLGFLVLLVATAAAIAWVTSDDDSPEEEEYLYTKETHLTHYPDGRIIEEEREY